MIFFRKRTKKKKIRFFGDFVVADEELLYQIFRDPIGHQHKEIYLDGGKPAAVYKDHVLVRGFQDDDYVPATFQGCLFTVKGYTFPRVYFFDKKTRHEFDRVARYLNKKAWEHLTLCPIENLKQFRKEIVLYYDPIQKENRTSDFPGI